MKRCPVCGKEYEDRPALSRKDNVTEICPTCGISEALEAAQCSMIYMVYSPEADITFIMKDQKKTISVVGFYYGEPDEEATKRFYGRLIAEFE